jgi:hypothetical protein
MGSSTREDDILADGQTGRVPMLLRDSLQRAVADAAASSGLRFADGSAGVVGSRPGFVCTTDSERIRRDAYDQSKIALQEAWRTPPAGNTAAPTALGAPPTSDARPLISMADAERIRFEAYQASVEALSTAWRGGR